MKNIIILFLFFLQFSFIQGEKIIELRDISNPRQIKIIGKNLYIVDDFEIKLFSLIKGTLVVKFGKNGEGPGEFISRPSIAVINDLVIATEYGPKSKVVFFDKRGKLSKEIKPPLFTRFYSVNGNFMSIKNRTDLKSNTTLTKVRILDKDLNPIKEIYTDKTRFQPRSSLRKGEKKFERYPLQKWAITNGEYIYIVDTRRGFYIEIYSYTGNRISVIEKKRKKINFTSIHKKTFFDNLKKSPLWERTMSRYKFIFPKHFPDINNISGNNELIFVSTYKEKNDKSELIIMNHLGVIKKTVFVPKVFPISINNSKFYYLRENEVNETWELHSLIL